MKQQTIRIREGISEFERQVLIKMFKETIGEIVELKFKREEDQIEEGDISISFKHLPDNFVGNTKGARFYYDKDDLTKFYNYQSVRINLRILEMYKESNHYYAWLNATLHEVACHALTDTTAHMEAPQGSRGFLCTLHLSTDKLLWSKKDIKYIKGLLKKKGDKINE